jgi:O-antigen/teichoic acid export membrane protein
MLVGCAVVGVAIALRDPIATQFFGGSDNSPVILYLALGVLSNLYFRNAVQFLRADRRIREMNLWRTGRILVEMGVIAAGTVLLDNVVDIIAAVAVTYSVFAVLVGVRIGTLYGVSTPRLNPLMRYLRFSLPLLVSGVAFWIVSFSDRWIVTYFAGIGPVGSYAVMYTLTTPIALVTSPIANAIFPDLSELESSDKTDEALARVRDALRYYLAFAVPAAVGVWIVADKLATALATPQVAEATYTVPYLATGMVFFGVFRIYTQTLKSRDREKITGGIWILIAAINVGVNVVLVPRLGILGAAGATTLAFGLGCVMVLLISPSVEPSVGALGKIVGATSVMTVVAIATMQMLSVGQFTVVVVIAVSVLAYAVTLATVGFLTGEERQFLVARLRRLRGRIWDWSPL